MSVTGMCILNGTLLLDSKFFKSNMPISLRIFRTSISGLCYAFLTLRTTVLDDRRFVRDIPAMYGSLRQCNFWTYEKIAYNSDSNTDHLGKDVDQTYHFDIAPDLNPNIRS
jgi:hypothetical protein